MRRRAAFILFVLLVSYAPAAFAQRAEASVNVGYSVSEGISTENHSILGRSFDTIAADSGASFNFTFGYLFTDSSGVEFLWGRQNSRLQADGPAGKLPISELAIYNYMFNYIYNFGLRDTRVRPYLFGGLGWTQYSFGNFLVAGGTGDIENETRFATNWGGGVKFYFAPNVGAKVGVRWTPTYIKSDPAGLWCDPFYGCWQLVDDDYSNQFETTFGVSVRF
jgi:opacity protein-like surface antigen